MPSAPPSRPRPRSLAAACALALAGLVLGLAVAPLGADSATVRRAKEYDLKATFLFHFTSFVEWPARAFDGPDAPFTLCVLSPDPFGNALREVVAGERAAGRELRLRTVESASEARGCQIVFVPHQRDGAIVRYLPGATDGLVLTVGEGDDFLDRGGMVRFELREDRIRLLVSRRALGDSELQMSSRLLNLAHVE